jgi:hypothetical protein
MAFLLYLFDIFNFSISLGLFQVTFMLITVQCNVDTRKIKVSKMSDNAHTNIFIAPFHVYR